MCTDLTSRLISCKVPRALTESAENRCQHRRRPRDPKGKPGSGESRATASPPTRRSSDGGKQREKWRGKREGRNPFSRSEEGERGESPLGVLLFFGSCCCCWRQRRRSKERVSFREMRGGEREAALKRERGGVGSAGWKGRKLFQIKKGARLVRVRSSSPPFPLLHCDASAAAHSLLSN